MPELPIFVSSKDSTSDGNFAIKFEPALRIPDDAKSATVSCQQMTCSYTMPNVTDDNNCFVVSVPNADNTAFGSARDGSARRFLLHVPKALYDVSTSEDAINRAVNTQGRLATDKRRLV